MSSQETLNTTPAMLSPPSILITSSPPLLSSPSSSSPTGGARQHPATGATASTPPPHQSFAERKRLQARLAASYSRSSSTNTMAGQNRFVGRKTFAATFSLRDREVTSGVPRGINLSTPASTAYSPNEDASSKHSVNSTGGAATGSWSGKLYSKTERTANSRDHQNNLPSPNIHRPSTVSHNMARSTCSSVSPNRFGGSRASSPSSHLVKKEEGDEEEGAGEEEVDEFGFLTGKVIVKEKKPRTPLDYEREKERMRKEIVQSRRVGTPGPGAYEPKLDYTTSITSPNQIKTPCNVKMAANALHSRYGFSASPFAAPFTIASSVFSSGGGEGRTTALETGGFATSQGIQPRPFTSPSRTDFAIGAEGGNEHRGPLYSLISTDNHMGKRAYVALIQTKRSMEALYKYLVDCNLTQQELGKVMIMIVTWELRREVAEKNRRRMLGYTDVNGTTSKSITVGPNTTHHNNRSSSPTSPSKQAKGAGGEALPKNSSDHFKTSASALANLIGENTAETLLRNSRHRGALSEEGDRLLKSMFPEQLIRPVAVRAPNDDDADNTTTGNNGDGRGGQGPMKLTGLSFSQTTSSEGASLPAGEGGEEGAVGGGGEGGAGAGGGGDVSLASKRSASATSSRSFASPMKTAGNGKVMLQASEGEGGEDVQWNFTVDHNYNVILCDRHGNIRPHPATLKKEMMEIVNLASLDADGLSNPNCITPAVVHKLSYKHPIFVTERIQIIAHVAAIVNLTKAVSATNGGGGGKRGPSPKQQHHTTAVKVTEQLSVSTSHATTDEEASLSMEEAALRGKRGKPPKSCAMSSSTKPQDASAKGIHKKYFLTDPTSDYPRDINEIARNILSLLPKPLSEQQQELVEEEERKHRLKQMMKDNDFSKFGVFPTTSNVAIGTSQNANDTSAISTVPSSSSLSPPPRTTSSSSPFRVGGGGSANNNNSNNTSNYFSPPATPLHQKPSSPNRTTATSASTASPARSSQQQKDASKGKEGQPAYASNSSPLSSLMGTGSHFIWTPPSMVDSNKGGVIAMAGRDDHDVKVAALRKQLVDNLRAKEKARRKEDKAAAAAKLLGQATLVANSANGNDGILNNDGDGSGFHDSGNKSPRNMANNNNKSIVQRENDAIVASDDYAPYREIYPPEGGKSLLRFRGVSYGEVDDQNNKMMAGGGGGMDASWHDEGVGGGTDSNKSLLLANGRPNQSSANSVVPAGLTAGLNYLGNLRPIRTQYDPQPVIPLSVPPPPLPTGSPTTREEEATTRSNGSVVASSLSGGGGRASSPSKTDASGKPLRNSHNDLTTHHQHAGYHGYYTVEYPPLPSSLRPLGDDDPLAKENKVGDATGGDVPIGIEVADRFVGNDPSKFNNTMHIATHFSYVDSPTKKLMGFQKKRRQKELEAQQTERILAMEQQRIKLQQEREDALGMARGFAPTSSSSGGGLNNHSTSNHSASAASQLARLIHHPAFQDSSSDEEEDELRSAVIARNFTSHSYHISDSPPCLNTKGAFTRSGGARTMLSALTSVSSAKSSNKKTIPFATTQTSFQGSMAGVGGNSSAFVIPSSSVIKPLTEAQRTQRYLSLLKQERGASINAATILPKQLEPDDSGFRYDALLPENRSSMTDNRLRKLHRHRDKVLSAQAEAMHNGSEGEGEEGAKKKQLHSGASPGAILIKQFAGVQYPDECNRQERDRQRALQRQMMQQQQQQSQNGTHTSDAILHAYASPTRGYASSSSKKSDPTLSANYTPSSAACTTHSSNNTSGGGGSAMGHSMANMTTLSSHNQNASAAFGKSKLISSLFGDQKDLTDDADVIESTRRLLASYK